MKYFIWWKNYHYDEREMSEFQDANTLMEFVNKNAGNPDFSFTIVKGTIVGLEPVNVVIQYRIRT